MFRKPISRRALLIGTGVVAAGVTVGYFWGSDLLPILPSKDDPDADAGRHWLHMAKDGTVVMSSPVHDLGQGTPFSLAQVVAEELNLAARDIKVVLAGTDQIPYMRFTTGSYGISAHMRPMARAAAALREELRRRAAAKLAEPVGDIRDADGGFLGKAGQLAYGEILPDEEIFLNVETLPDAPLYSFDPTREVSQVGAGLRDPRDSAIVTGAPLYAGDIRFPDMAYGGAVQAPLVTAQIKSVDLGQARTLPGVIDIVVDKGKALVGVVAETPGALDRAMAEIQVTWDRPESFDDAYLRALVDVDQKLAGGKLEHLIAGEEFNTAADWTVDHRIDLPPIHHAAQEPRTAVARFDRRNGVDIAEIWVGTQDVFVNRNKAARELGWPEERVIVHPMRVGGAFGGRALYDVAREALLLARAVERPVKVQWSRRDEFYGDRVRPPSSHRIRLRADDSGRISDWWQATVSGHILLSEIMAPEWALDMARMFIADFDATRGIVPPYAAARRRIEFEDVELPIHVGQWRSLGATPNTCAIETAMDALARKTGIDPVELRLRNIGSEQPRLAACLCRVKEITEQTPLPEGAARGYACGIYHDHSYVAAAFDVTRDEAGQFRVLNAFCVLDVGLAVNPDRIRAQAEGCLLMAIGQVLMERAGVINGAFAAERFSDYPTPCSTDAPKMWVEIIDDRETAPSGAGEAPLVAAVPALVNAISGLTGKAINELPVA